MNGHRHDPSSLQPERPEPSEPSEPSEPVTTKAPILPAKARILAASFVDIVIDLALPTMVYILLSPTGLPDLVRLSIGGFFVAAKACSGPIVDTLGEAGADRAIVKLALATLVAAFCTAVTIVTLRLGGSALTAISAGVIVLSVVEGVKLARRPQRIDGFAALVLVEIAATLILTWISDDPRWVLMRPSFYTAIAGFYALSTVWTDKPFMMQVTRSIAAGGDPNRAEAFDRAGRESVPFIRAERAMTLGLALVLFAEAVLRIVTVLLLPPADIAANSILSQLPGFAVFVTYIVLIRFIFVPRASREVDALMPENDVLQ